MLKSMPGRRLRIDVLQEEADHLSAGVRSARVRVGALDSAAEPSMARAVKDPLLKGLPAVGGALDRAGIGHAACRLATRHDLGQRPLRPCLGDDLVAVDGVDCPVRIAMEDNGRDHPSFTPGPNSPAPAHGGKGCGHIPGRAAAYPRMDA